MPTITLTKPRLCDQRCGDQATVYAIDPCPDGWGGHYCDRCAVNLGFTIIDTYEVAPWIRQEEPTDPEKGNLFFDEWPCEECGDFVGYTLWGDNQGGWVEFFQAGDRKVCESCLPPDKGFHVCDLCVASPEPLEVFPTTQGSWLLAYEPTEVARHVCPTCSGQADEWSYLVVTQPMMSSLLLIATLAGMGDASEVKILSALSALGYEGKW